MKLLYTTIIFLCLSAYGHSQTKNTSNQSFVRVSFKGLHCDGKNGLCALVSSENQLANASLVYNIDGTLSILIRRDKIDEAEIETLFGMPYDEKFRAQPITFGVGKEFLLNETMQRDLEITNNTTRIILDRYPVEITEEHFIIKLNLE